MDGTATGSSWPISAQWKGFRFLPRNALVMVQSQSIETFDHDVIRPVLPVRRCGRAEIDTPSNHWSYQRQDWARSARNARGPLRYSRVAK